MHIYIYRVDHKNVFTFLKFYNSVIKSRRKLYLVSFQSSKQRLQICKISCESEKEFMYWKTKIKVTSFVVAQARNLSVRKK